MQSELFKRHPWHGVHLGADAPALVTCYIEIVPADTVKYELDKLTGHLKIDRPQKYSSICSALYGLLPQTFCGERHSVRLGAGGSQLPGARGQHRRPALALRRQCGDCWLPRGSGGTN